MRVSKKTIYAIILMLALAKNEGNGTLTMKEIAEKEEISVKYLEQIVSVLCKAGFVKSQRGSRGGYRLSRASKEYTLGSIIRAVEGDISDEYIEDKGVLAKFWDGLYKEINEYMDGVTIKDIIEDEKLSSQIYDYCI
jgi:Rrf2 family protein